MAELKVETWSIDRLIPYARNPRRNDEQVDRMASAIKEFGFRIPIVARSDGSLVDGHLRLKAAQKLGLKEVPVALADELTDAQVKAFRILANKSANWAEWEPDLLKLELEDLQDMDFNLELTGFELPELEDILGAGEGGGTEGQTDPDAVPEAQEEPVSREGDVWILGRHRLMCGDSTDAGSVALLMAGAVADVCITSPPYGADDAPTIRNHYRPGMKKLKSFYDKHDDCATEWPALMKGFFNVARQSSVAQFINVQMLAKNKNSLIDFLAENNSKLVDVLIWDKTHGAPQMHENVLNNDFEFVFVFAEDGATRAIPFSSFHGDKSNILRIAKGANQYSDIHKAVYPVALPVDILHIASKAKTVYEPFAGTGTTVIACEQENRSCFAMELSPRYCDVIVRRWQEFTGQDATLESSGKTFDETGAERS